MSVQDDREDVWQRSRMGRALAEAGFEDVQVISRKSAREVLTEKRIELLERLRDGEFESVTDLADDLDRDKGDVSRDLTLLTRKGVVTYGKDGTRKVPELAHETIVVEPIL